MDIHNATFSPLADAKLTQFVGQPQIDSVLSKLSELSGWTIALTLLLVAVAYDQCKSRQMYTRGRGTLLTICHR
jgi:C-22 sterol desaturase